MMASQVVTMANEKVYTAIQVPFSSSSSSSSLPSCCSMVSSSLLSHSQTHTKKGGKFFFVEVEKEIFPNLMVIICTVFFTEKNCKHPSLSWLMEDVHKKKKRWWGTWELTMKKAPLSFLSCLIVCVLRNWPWHLVQLSNDIHTGLDWTTTATNLHPSFVTGSLFHNHTRPLTVFSGLSGLSLCVYRNYRPIIVNMKEEPGSETYSNYFWWWLWALWESRADEGWAWRFKRYAIFHLLDSLCVRRCNDCAMIKIERVENWTYTQTDTDTLTEWMIH